MVLSGVSHCMAFWVVALNIALYLHNLPTATGADIWTIWLNFRNLCNPPFILPHFPQDCFTISPAYVDGHVRHFPDAFPSRTLTVKLSSQQARTPVWESRSKNEPQELEYLFFCFSALLANTSKGHLFLSEASVVRSLTPFLDFRNIKKDGGCPEATAPSRRGAALTGGTVPRASYLQFSWWSGSVWLRELLLAAQPGAWASSFS